MYIVIESDGGNLLSCKHFINVLLWNNLIKFFNYLPIVEIIYEWDCT